MKHLHLIAMKEDLDSLFIEPGCITGSILIAIQQLRKALEKSESVFIEITRINGHVEIVILTETEVDFRKKVQRMYSESIHLSTIDHEV